MKTIDSFLLGKKLYEIRIKQNITQENLAKSVFVSRTVVSRWESGKIIPDLV